MKHMCLTVAAVVALALPLSAQSTKVDIPFEFAVGTATAPAGNYYVTSMSGSHILEIRSADSRNHFFGRLLAGGVDPNGSRALKVLFHRYGDRYFLSQVWTRTSKIDFPASRRERELRTSATAQEIVLPVLAGE